MTAAPRPVSPAAPALDAREEARWRELLRLARSSYDVRPLTAAYTLVRTDGTAIADASGGAFAVTLPLAAEVPGQTYRVKKTDASANAVTVTRAGTDLIDGAATYVLAIQYQSVTIQSTGWGWIIL